jgi:predicted DNA-binding transcriptional regulator AlpA
MRRINQSQSASTRLLRPKEVAERLNVSEELLAVWRATKRYPRRWTKIGSLVRYRECDVRAFIESRMCGGVS